MSIQIEVVEASDFIPLTKSEAMSALDQMRAEITNETVKDSKVKECCKNCLMFKLADRDPTPYYRAFRPEGEPVEPAPAPSYGACRYEHPSAKHGFPTVTVSDWCGDWCAKKDQGDFAQSGKSGAPDRT